MPIPEGHRVCTVTEAAHRLGCSDYLVREGIRRLRILATQSRKRGPWDVYLPDDGTALRALRGTLQELTARPPLELRDKQEEGTTAKASADPAEWQAPEVIASSPPPPIPLSAEHLSWGEKASTGRPDGADEAWLVLLRIYQRLAPQQAGSMAMREPTLTGIEQQIAARISVLHDEVLRLGLANRYLTGRVGAMQEGETGSR